MICEDEVSPVIRCSFIVIPIIEFCFVTFTTTYSNNNSMEDIVVSHKTKLVWTFSVNYTIVHYLYWFVFEKHDDLLLYYYSIELLMYSNNSIIFYNNTKSTRWKSTVSKLRHKTSYFFIYNFFFYCRYIKSFYSF